MKRSSILTTTTFAAMLAAAPAVAFAASNSSNMNGASSSQGSSETNSGQTGASGIPSQQLSQNEVQEVQQKLQQDGYYTNGQIDGVVGPQTHQALKQLQQAKGLPQTGQLDQQTLAALDINGQGGQNNGTTGTMNGGSSGNMNGNMGNQGAGAGQGAGNTGGTGHQGGG